MREASISGELPLRVADAGGEHERISIHFWGAAAARGCWRDISITALHYFTPPPPPFALPKEGGKGSIYLWVKLLLRCMGAIGE